MKKFNVRVYGILINDRQELLVTDELINNMEITKLPGGGLEFGEGTSECIVREFLEETGFAVEVTGHFYTTDFFVASAFNPDSQVISIYYKVRFKGVADLKVVKEKYAFSERVEGAQTFRWIPMSSITPEEFTFPIDKRWRRCY